MRTYLQTIIKNLGLKAEVCSALIKIVRIIRSDNSFFFGFLFQIFIMCALMHFLMRSFAWFLQFMEVIDFQRFLHIDISAFHARKERTIFSISHIEIRTAEAFHIRELGVAVLNTDSNALFILLACLFAAEGAGLHFGLAVALGDVHLLHSFSNV